MIRYETHIPLMNKEKPFKERIVTIEPKDKDNFIVNLHQNLELLYLIEGNIEVITNGVSVRLDVGDIAVVNASYIHDIFYHSNSRFYFIIINTDFLSEFGIKIDKVEFNRLVRSEKAKKLILDIMQVCQEKPAEHVLIAKAGILSLVTELYVNHSKERNELYGDYGKEKFEIAKNIIEYIKQNYAKKITLKTISEVVGYNKYYVSHVFKSIVGVTVMTYLNTFRIFIARELLKTKKHSVSEVCYTCGFDNLSYFARTYKKHIGNPPSADIDRRGK